MALFAWQLVTIQGIDAADTREKALRSRVTRTEIPAPRGQVLDTTGKVVARSVERRNVTGDPFAAEEYPVNKKKKEGIPGVAKAIANVVGGDPVEIQKRFETAKAKKSRFVYVLKDISPAQWSQISALNLPGIYSEQFEKREYPSGTALSSLLGWVNNAGQPGGGIEQMMNTELKGKDGIHQIERGRDGQQIATGDNLDVPPVSGRSVHLTIDNDLQWYASNELARRVKESKAKGGDIVIANVKGEILAAASYPTFDNNDMKTATPDSLENRAFTDAFEPGSTQKIVTIGSVLDKGIMTPTSHVEVPSQLKRSGRPFNDAEKHGTEYLTLAGVIAKSSNIGTILAGEKVPPAELRDKMSKLGLGQRPGIGFPGESAGLIPKVWNGDTWYTIMFGQGMATSPLQQIGIFQTVANKGVRTPLKLIKGVQDVDGAVKAPADDRESTRVFTEKTSRELIDMMIGVVSKDGSAEKAAVPGYDVAGKTSTAQIYNPEKKAYDGVNAGFIGMAPAKNPQLIISVNIDRPASGTFGGTVAAPTFAKVMAYALSHEKIPPSKTDKLPYPITYREESKSQ